MASSTRNENKVHHVVMVPWCAFGHMIPFFELSKSIATAGVSVSFVSTPRNIERLPKLPPHLETLITLVSLPMASVAELPPGAEATIDLPGYDSNQYLKIAYDLLHQPFRDYVSAARPDWIIADLLPHWAADVSLELGVPLMLFSIFPTHALLFTGPAEGLLGDGQMRSPESMTSPPEWVDFPSTVALRGFEAPALHQGVFEVNASGVSDAARLAKLLLACRAVSIRSCFEVEAQYLNAYAKLIKRDVIPVGLLPREETGRPRSRDVKSDQSGEWDDNFKWLDEQRERSVVFVGFGSEVKLSKEQVHEIARGLEVSEQAFLWALRRPSWAGADEEALPGGFGNRTAGRGIVSMGWAPQMEIMAHKAIGGCMIQSGWGSVIETLQFGHCLVLLPMIIDQGLISRFLVEKGLAVEVPRGDDGSVAAEDVAESLRLAMVKQEGEGVRNRAREARALFGDTNLHQQKYIQGFVNYLKKGA